MCNAPPTGQGPLENGILTCYGTQVYTAGSFHG